ncbi:hypothetical protein X726_22015 [Mesorhizobium sp. L103C105A0]|nr:hypothetical protein X726_22015 [Mesorhizobium sp. L103C105A0]
MPKSFELIENPFSRANCSLLIKSPSDAMQIFS